jgi:hypothetical protein
MRNIDIICNLSTHIQTIFFFFFFSPRSFRTHLVETTATSRSRAVLAVGPKKSTKKEKTENKKHANRLCRGRVFFTQVFVFALDDVHSARNAKARSQRSSASAQARSRVLGGGPTSRPPCRAPAPALRARPLFFFFESFDQGAKRRRGEESEGCVAAGARDEAVSRARAGSNH